MKHKVTIGWKHTIIDTATVEVEAPSRREAIRIALEAAEKQKPIDGKPIEWRDGEVVEGDYKYIPSAER